MADSVELPHAPVAASSQSFTAPSSVTAAHADRPTFIAGWDRHGARTVSIIGYPDKVLYGLHGSAVILQGLHIFEGMGRGCLQLTLREGVTDDMAQWWMAQTLPQASFFHAHPERAACAAEGATTAAAEAPLQLDRDVPFELRLILATLKGLRHRAGHRFFDDLDVLSAAPEGGAVDASPFRSLFAALIIAAAVVACEHWEMQGGMGGHNINKEVLWIGRLIESWMWRALPPPLRESFVVDLCAIFGAPSAFLWKERQQSGLQEAVKEVELQVPSMEVLDAAGSWEALRPPAESTPSTDPDRQWRLERERAQCLPLLVNVHVTGSASDQPSRRWEQHLLTVDPPDLRPTAARIRWRKTQADSYDETNSIAVEQISVIALGGFSGTDSSARPTLFFTLDTVPVRTYAVEVLLESGADVSTVATGQVVTMDGLWRWVEAFLCIIRRSRDLRVQTTQGKGETRQEQDKAEKPLTPSTAWTPSQWEINMAAAASTALSTASTPTIQDSPVKPPEHCSATLNRPPVI